MKKERVVVAMSGGVDSSVAAALLKNQGYEVIGITLCFNLPNSTAKRPSCCGIQGIEDAQSVCHKLGIRHYILNMQKVLNERVIKDFCEEYLKGRTPNPCIRCNQYIKFDALLKKALSLGARYLATGHYARIRKATSHLSVRQAGKPQTTSYLLKKAKDLKKDQSYFLYRLGQKQLKHILFPLGNYTKGQVRNLAKEFDLPVADKLASQEICFLPNEDYRRFLVHRLSQISKSQMITDVKPGLIVDSQGNILGQHRGIAFYTIGQREGLGIAKGYPLYVTKIEPKNNQITVGKREEAHSKEFLVKKIHFIVSPLKKRVALKIKIRYNHQEMPAQVLPFGSKIKVRFKKPEFAVTPGQSAVFYDKDIIVGGGIIDKVIC
jgi:tRNA-specific 2-thiouridylase